MRRAWIVIGGLCLAGCGSDSTRLPKAVGDTSIQDLSLTSVQPAIVLPGTSLGLHGSFGANLTDVRLVLQGEFAGVNATVTLPSAVTSSERLDVGWPGASGAGLAASEGVFAADAHVEARGAIDGRRHLSPKIRVTLDLREGLAPAISNVSQGVIFINDSIVVDGDGFLLGAAEGSTIAIVEGCYQKEGAPTCDPVSATEITTTAATEFDRTRVTFPFVPKIGGITPGSFQGTVALRSSTGGAATPANPVSYDIVRPQIFAIDPPAASLGQYVDVTGGGFVGPQAAAPDPTAAVTTLEIVGDFTVAGSPTPIPTSLTLVPEFVAGNLVRYVLNEEDDLGTTADLRTVTGSFSGTVTPVTTYGSETVRGSDAAFNLGIEPVKQLVWVSFLPSYVESLRHFGLRAVDQRVRDRALDAARRVFSGTNAEFRTERPDDFALFTQIDISGPDPNGVGLLGYDNTPGKDVDNLRLYDKIGGLNALTQEDGYPGYGGVFVESLFGFSMHPGDFATIIEGADPTFDDVFDPFRPDLGGKPVLAADLSGTTVPVLTSGDGCPSAGSRPERIACAVWVLGSLIGDTLAHEFAHSLGLADPTGTDFHNSGSAPDRLMDSGSSRSFKERAAVLGEGPAVLCGINYEYVRQILPLAEPDPIPSRPSCF